MMQIVGIAVTLSMVGVAAAPSIVGFTAALSEWIDMKAAAALGS